MKSISCTSLRKNLSSVLNTVEHDHIAYLIKRKNHKNIILLTEEEYESTQETLYLLSNPINANRIKESIEQAKQAKFVYTSAIN
ncbi:MULTISPECIES: type II toxin-antitoxin system Phd/YefM family antitoxin [unclassified Rickettsia]|uniref:type II toxin-antitoxin system Phd/YefM family antitoxin n=1 Tax=unclassified Rickettsia TaxID=114295 RepID=UPI00209F62E7|nr:type II toxin-antitoxin system Phd/YefM family antitoxin [Rickettsia endosymbiont of Ceutorhynchus assimilis]